MNKKSLILCFALFIFTNFSQAAFTRVYIQTNIDGTKEVGSKQLATDNSKAFQVLSKTTNKQLKSDYEYQLKEYNKALGEYMLKKNTPEKINKPEPVYQPNFKFVSLIYDLGKTRDTKRLEGKLKGLQKKVDQHNTKIDERRAIALKLVL